MLDASQIVLIDPVVERVFILGVHPNHILVVSLILGAELLWHTTVPDSTNRVVAFVLRHQLEVGHVLYN